MITAFFDNWQNFIAMGTHGKYVWSAYFITLLVLLWNIASPLLIKNKLQTKFKQIYSANLASKE